MTFRIQRFLDAATSDKELRQHIIAVHDDLIAAHKIVDSAADAVGVGASRSDQVLLAVFQELRRFRA